MTDFFFTGAWGAAWFASLIITALFVLTGPHRSAHALVAILVANWLVTRSVVFFGLSDWLWAVNDFATTAAFAIIGRSTASRACAVLFFIILQFDVALIFDWAGFEAVAAVSDLLGYLILFIIAGSSREGTGRYIRASMAYVTNR